MKWLEWLRQERKESGGTKAVQDAYQHLLEDEARWTEVSRVSDSLRQSRLENHFVDRIAHIFEGK